jgi:hypothetical protein
MIKQNEYYRAIENIDVLCLFDGWLGSTGVIYSTTLSEDEIVKTEAESAPSVVSIRCAPQNYNKLKKKYFPLKQRIQFWKYRKYYFMIEEKNLKTKFQKIEK